MDPDMNPDEAEEKQRLINQVLELQNTLDGKAIYNWLAHWLGWLHVAHMQKMLLLFMPPFEKGGAYCFAHVGRYVGRSVCRSVGMSVGR